MITAICTPFRAADGQGSGALFHAPNGETASQAGQDDGKEPGGS